MSIAKSTSPRTVAAEPATGSQENIKLRRRTALSLMASGALAAATRPGAAFAQAAGPTPRLATPAQIEAEQQLLTLLQDPALKPLQSKIRDSVASTARGKRPEAAALIDNAIAQWTNALIFGELTDYRPYPAFLWGTDDTPRTWLGHTLGGVGASGDNPDNIYRSASIDGSGRYEILGQIDLARRPAQIVIEADKADIARPQAVAALAKKSHDIVSAAVTTDRQLKIAPDGSFRISVNGPGTAGPNHFVTPTGRITIGVRDVLSNWNENAARLSIRRLDSSAPQPYGLADARQHMLEDLPGYVGFWAAFPDIWMGGLKPNSFKAPAKRPGGWGFLAGLRFQITPGQAVVVTTSRGAARYTGFQLTDPWMIAPDARLHQCCLNISQATPDADGAFTYVISLTDPGVANWLDPAGIHDGFGILRWQNIPPDMTADELFHSLRVVSLDDVAKLPGVARITPAQRQQQLAARIPGYNHRVS